MNMQISAQTSALATERPKAPLGELECRNGDGQAVAQPLRARATGGQPISTPGSPSRKPTGDWAICCSGGGIRSATYCLGGLQSLHEGGLLGRAKWIVGVSGGSYIAASRALVAARPAAGPS